MGFATQTRSKPTTLKEIVVLTFFNQLDIRQKRRVVAVQDKYAVFISLQNLSGVTLKL